MNNITLYQLEKIDQKEVNAHWHKYRENGTIIYEQPMVTVIAKK